jgi:hypothetical protein
MKIRIGEIFRVSRAAENPEAGGLRSYFDLTRSAHPTSADVNKGIWAYKDVVHRATGQKRTPAILLHSNTFKEGSAATPWVDITESDLGYAFYNGDNRQSGRRPTDAPGNRLLSRVQALYNDPQLRQLAPPILLFTQHDVEGSRKGYRRFAGYGVPTRHVLVSQQERGTGRYFTNLAMELCLFRLDTENEEFDWNWIDHRRDSDLPVDLTLSAAPAAWRAWVREGDAAIEKCRRRVARRRVTSVASQLSYSDSDRSLLSQISSCFGDNPHAFEGLASLVAERVIGHGCRRAWVTRRAGDGGVDFVARLDVGSQFSRMGVVILGQAKCIAPTSSVSGRDLARLVARLQRGWFGVFVTTGAFSAAAQLELHEDGYPVVLINGQRLAREIRTLLNIEGVTLTDLLHRERLWYDANLRAMDPARALEDLMFTPQLAVDSDPERTSQ